MNHFDIMTGNIPIFPAGNMAVTEWYLCTKFGVNCFGNKQTTGGGHKMPLSRTSYGKTIFGRIHSGPGNSG